MSNAHDDITDFEITKITKFEITKTQKSRYPENRTLYFLN